jgi:hypothetical protein
MTAQIIGSTCTCTATICMLTCLDAESGMVPPSVFLRVATPPDLMLIL